MVGHNLEIDSSTNVCDLSKLLNILSYYMASEKKDVDNCSRGHLDM